MCNVYIGYDMISIMFICKDMCINEPNIKGGRVSYDDGYKKCIICEKSIKTSDRKCYCCHNILRVCSRVRRYKTSHKQLTKM